LASQFVSTSLQQYSSTPLSVGQQLPVSASAAQMGKAEHCRLSATGDEGDAAGLRVGGLVGGRLGLRVGPSAAGAGLGSSDGASLVGWRRGRLVGAGVVSLPALVSLQQLSSVPLIVGQQSPVRLRPRQTGKAEHRLLLSDCKLRLKRPSASDCAKTLPGEA
jgi:hypothetical protein